MPYPQLRDLWDANDIFEFPPLDTQQPATPLTVFVDRLHFVDSPERVEGTPTNAAEQGNRRTVTLALTCTPAQLWELRRFHEKGVFWFSPDAPTSIKVKWTDRNFIPVQQPGESYELSFSLLEVS